MQKQPNNRLVSWIVTRPTMFAIIAFITMAAASMIASLIGHTGIVTAILITVAFLGSAAWLVRMLPGTNLDRRSFVALNNAQASIASIAFIVSTLIVIYNAPNIMLHLLWFESHSSVSFIAIIAIMAIFYLYLCGVFIANLYAKYRRIRAMGVPMWKTLATAPFGFSMLWIPGYLMEDPTTKAPVINIKSRWYAKITDTIISHPIAACTTLMLLIFLSSFTFGFNVTTLTFMIVLIFAIWANIVGHDKLRKNISGTYATTAIVINLITIAAICGYVTYRKTQTIIPETPTTIQYTDTIQQQ